MTSSEPAPRDIFYAHKFGFKLKKTGRFSYFERVNFDRSLTIIGFRYYDRDYSFKATRYELKNGRRTGPQSLFSTYADAMLKLN